MGEIPGKFVDDTQHEYNASAKMNLPSQDFVKVILYMKKKLKMAKYDIDDFNCANFAIEAFNSARSNDPLIVPKHNIPGGTTRKGSETPQGLYRELFRLKRDKMAGVEFTFPQNKAYAETTKIPCK
ncbi:MAG: hypothetical protein JNK79_03210 [Chitinophagaceae bacterium]|nr:hypothetical protein [Chitinophagaceae bacterium]